MRRNIPFPARSNPVSSSASEEMEIHSSSSSLYLMEIGEVSWRRVLTFDSRSVNEVMEEEMKKRRNSSLNWSLT